RNLSHDCEPEPARIEYGVDLLDVVSEEPDLRQTEILENLNTNVLIPHIVLITQGMISIDGIHAFILQGIGLDFFGQADPTSLLWKIDQDTRLLSADHLERQPQLITAVATE